MRHKASISRWLLVLSIATLCPHSAAAQGTSAASISGVVTDNSGGVLPDVAVEVSSPVLIEKVRLTMTGERGEYRIVELRPGTYTVTFTRQGFATFRREGIELTSNFNAAINAELRVGGLEQSITVSGASPLVDTQNVARETVISKGLLDTVPTGKNLLSFYALTPAAVTPTNAQDVGGSKGETTARVSVHGSKQGDTKMMIDGMSFNSFEGEGSQRSFYVNALTAQEVIVDAPSGSTSAEYTSNGVVVNLIPRDGGNRFSGTIFATGSNHKLQAENLTTELQAAGAKTTSGTRSVYDLNGVLAGPIKRDRVWFMTSHRAWGRRERVANLFHDMLLDDPYFTPADGSNGRPFEPGEPSEGFRSDNIRVTWQVNPKNKVNALYEHQSTTAQNNFSSLNAGTMSMEAGNPYCYKDDLIMATWSDTPSNKLLFEGGVLLLNTDTNTFKNPCAGIPTGRLYRDTTLSFAFNGNGPLQTKSAQRPFRQRFSMSYLTASHHIKVGLAVEESLPRPTRTDRGPTPFSYTFRAGVPISLTEFASPTVGGELKIRPDLGLFVQDQWKLDRFTINVGLRYEYHRVYADSLTTPAGPLVDAHDLPRVDCIPCWHDLNPRLGVAWDVFGDGQTAVKASMSRYVALASYVQSRTFAPQNAIVASTSRSWADPNSNLLPDCDLRNPNANGECGPMANRSFGQSVLVTRPDPDWITGWGQARLQLVGISEHRPSTELGRGSERRLLPDDLRQPDRDSEPGDDASRLRSVLHYGAGRLAFAGKCQRRADLRLVRHHSDKVRRRQQHRLLSQKLRAPARALQWRGRQFRCSTRARHQSLGRLERRERHQHVDGVSRRDHVEVEHVLPRQFAAGPDVHNGVRQHGADRLRNREPLSASIPDERVGRTAIWIAGGRSLSESPGTELRRELHVRERAKSRDLAETCRAASVLSRSIWCRRCPNSSRGLNSSTLASARSSVWHTAGTRSTSTSTTC
jgi:hypothetical protein